MKEKYFADDRFIIPDDIKNMSPEELDKAIENYEREAARKKAVSISAGVNTQAQKQAI